MTKPIALSVLAIILATLGTGCATEPAALLSNECVIWSEVVADHVAIQVPTLECDSRTCLAITDDPQEPATKGICTELCGIDEDCADIQAGSCAGGFVCATVTITGPFCCKPMCVCSDDVDQLPPGQPVPPECDPTNPGNTCPNLQPT